MVVDQRDSYLHNLRASMMVVVSPIQYIVTLPVSFINWLDSEISSHKTLLNENTVLKQQLLQRSTQLQRMIALERENSQLRALLKSSSRVNGKILTAQLLAVNSDPFVHEVVVNKGSHHGVYLGQPVLDAYGVMGQIIAVSPFTSRVLLIDDSRSAIPVQVNRSGMRAIAKGQGGMSILKLAYVPDTADIKIGDTLVTSGLGQHYPAGYPVGKVQTIHNDPGQPFATITIEPSAYLNRSRQVLLVWPEANYKKIFSGKIAKVADVASNKSLGGRHEQN